METQRRRTRTATRLATIGVLGALTAGAVASSAASADQTPSSIQVWDHRDGYRSTVYWNYKGIDDGWKALRPQDGAGHTYNRNLREGRRIYFIIQTDEHESPSYVSEYRTSGR